MAQTVEPGASRTDDVRLETITHERARFNLGDTGWAEIDRRGSTVLRLPEPPSPEALVHPLLSTTATASAYWSGDLSLHAGAIEVGGRCVGVLGERGAGKSSTLAYLARMGVTVLADDILVLRGDRVLAGPRCLDLRRTTAEWLESGTYLGVIGQRERWRMALGRAPAEVPLHGWVSLEWGPDVAMEPLPSRDRVQALARHLAIQIPPRDPVAFLDAAARPFWRLTRPQSLDAVHETCERLLDELGRSA